MLDNLENEIYTAIKVLMPSNIKEKYKSLDFTTSDINVNEASFPCVYVHMLESPESGGDTEGTSINAIYASFQIEVIDNEKQSNVTEVSKAILNIMKSMRFKVVGMPFFDNKDSTYRKVSRFRRMIANNDEL